MCSLRHSGHRLGARTASRLVKVKLQVRQRAGLILKALCRLLRMCSRCSQTSFSERCTACDRLLADHWPDCKISIISFRLVIADQ